jgi:nucleotide-binding universal stress UspA family protein
MRTFKTILHPTDFSPHSEKALALAAGIARDQGARLVILHAVPIEAPATGVPRTTALERAEHCCGDLEAYRHEMREKLRRLDVPAVPCAVERVLEEGEPAATILRKAEAIGCDLIVMGTHGRGEEFRRAMGSVAEEVSSNAPCPVITVRLPVTKPAERPEPEAAGAAR